MTEHVSLSFTVPPLPEDESLRYFGSAPPPYQDESVEYILDRLVEAVKGYRVDIKSDASSDEAQIHGQEEVKRVEKFLQYVMTIDYNSPFDMCLSLADGKHFTRMYTMLRDLSQVSTQAITSEERSTSASYFRHHLHAPCRKLKIPTEYVVILLSRFVKYLTPSGRYKGCVMDVLHEGIALLAVKLYIDREIMVPRIFRGPYGDTLVRKVWVIGKINFYHLRGTEGFTILTHRGRQWHSLQTIEYEAHEKVRARGQALIPSNPQTTAGRWSSGIKNKIVGLWR